MNFFVTINIILKTTGSKNSGLQWASRNIYFTTDENSTIDKRKDIIYYWKKKKKTIFPEKHGHLEFTFC